MERSLDSPRQRVLVDLLRSHREAAGMSQAELSTLIDEPQSFVSKYECGARRLDLIELEQITRALGVKLSELVNAFEAGA